MSSKRGGAARSASPRARRAGSLQRRYPRSIPGWRSSLVPDAWVDHRVDEVDDDVHDDDDQRIDDHDRLEQGVVALLGGADHQLAEPRPGEDFFGQHRTADQADREDADERDDRD